MHDIPYSLSVGPEVCASMTAVCTAVRGLCPTLPLGIQILSAANKPAIAVALASGTIHYSMLDYICSLFMHLLAFVVTQNSTESKAGFIIIYQHVALYPCGCMVPFFLNQV